MKTLNIPMEDKDYARLEKAKGDRNWREFILSLCDKEVK